MQTSTWSWDNQNGFYFKPLTRYPTFWKQEVYNTARILANNTDRKIYVCMSGGIDSEVVARALYEQKIDFSAITLEYDNNLNDHDIWYAKDFCQKRNIPMHIIRLDLIKFVKEEIPKYIASGYYAHNVFRFIQRRLVEEVENINGCAILGGGEQIFATKNNQVCLSKSPDAFSSINFAGRIYANHCVEFYMHNPEIHYAWMCEPIIEIMTGNEKYYPVDLKMSIEKMLIYHRYWNDMLHRKKYSGYEKIHQLREEIEKDLKSQFPELLLQYIPISKVKDDLFKDLDKGNICTV